MVRLRDRISEHVASLAWGAASLATGLGIVATASRSAASDLWRDALTAGLAKEAALGPSMAVQRVDRASVAGALAPSPLAAGLAPRALAASHADLVRPGRSFGLEISMGSVLIGMAALSLHRSANAALAGASAAPKATGAAAGRELFAWGATACLAGSRLLFFLGHGIDPGDLRHHTFGYGAVNGLLDAAGLMTVAVGGATVVGVAVGHGLMVPPSLTANRVAALLSSAAGLMWAGAMEMIAHPPHDPMRFHAWGPPMLLGAGAVSLAVGVGVGVLGAWTRAPAPAPAAGGQIRVVIEAV